MIDLLVVWCKGGEAKVCNSYLVTRFVFYLLDQDVVEFNVSMDNFLPLKEIQGK